MLTKDEIKELNRNVDVGILLTFLGAPPKNIRDLRHQGIDYRVNAWYRGGDNLCGLGVTYDFDKEKWLVTDFTHREFGNIDLIDFQRKALNIPFRKAIDNMIFAAGKSNGAKERIEQCERSSTNHLQKLDRPVPIDPSILNAFQQGLHPFWQRRHYTPDVARRFNLGFCEGQIGNLKHRLTIPITDELNRLVAVQGRTIVDDEFPKYTYTDSQQGESAKLTLYNYPYARHYGKERGWVGVVESANSVWRAYQYGYQNFCATLSTTVTERQVELLVKLGLNIVIFFDYDPAYTMAGQIGAVRLAKTLKQRGVKTWIVNPNMVCDPAQLSKDQFMMSLKGAIQYA